MSLYRNLVKLGTEEKDLRPHIRAILSASRVEYLNSQELEDRLEFQEFESDGISSTSVGWVRKKTEQNKPFVIDNRTGEIFQLLDVGGFNNSRPVKKGPLSPPFELFGPTDFRDLLEYNEYEGEMSTEEINSAMRSGTKFVHHPPSGRIFKLVLVGKFT